MTGPLIAYLGSEDIDKRIDLLLDIRQKYRVMAIGSSETIRSQFEAVGIDYLYYPLQRRLSPVADVTTFRSLVKLLRSQKIDLLHTFDTKPALVGRLAGRVAGIPTLVGTLPGLGILYTRHTIKTRLIRTVYQPLQHLACSVSDLTIFQNQDDRELFKRLGIVSEAKSMVICGSGIKTDVYNRANYSIEEIGNIRQRFTIPSDTIVVLMISRLLRSKGVMDFAEAARVLPQIRFVLVGGRDTSNADCLTEADMRFVNSHVQWLKTQSDISAILAASDIFVLPSTYREGIPRVLLEAASTGLPLVSYDTPGCREVVKHDITGLLVQQPSQLAQVIQQLAAEPVLRERYGAAARQWVQEQFDHTILVKAMLDLYARLID